MSLRYHSRWLPLSIVLACAITSAGASFALVAGDSAALAELETAALAEDADAEAWWRYAAALSAAAQDAHALQAIEQVLARSPYHEGARFERCLLLARGGDPEALLAWMEELVYTHPAMANNALQRPELAPYLGDVRFQDLAAEARVQAVD
jgi:thioredoxin-like negative regulator of GroEL